MILISDINEVIDIKRIRMLLRVSSNQQLEQNGDLNVQRQILKEYISNHKDWVLDTVEYFEGSKSAYKNTAMQRQVLQQILLDAKNKEFDILVPYKDDRVGRLMWDTAMYVMTLKKYGVDIYTVKDGCISPENDDIFGQMLLSLRYANAQKSSIDTGMRVKDTAAMLVKQGKFMGGRAPYGYKLEYSGEISKHGRALKHLVIDQSKKDIITEIFHLATNRNWGSVKIANYLNSNQYYKSKAPNEIWKATTITSILTNPVYAGKLAYKRREHISSGFCHNPTDKWILGPDNDKIKVIDYDIWLETQMLRTNRRTKISGSNNTMHSSVYTYRLDSIFDGFVICPFCNNVMKTKKNYNYWTRKNGMPMRSVYIKYYCKGYDDNSHNMYCFYHKQIETELFDAVANYLNNIFEDRCIASVVLHKQKDRINNLQIEMEQTTSELEDILVNIRLLEGKYIKQLSQDEAPFNKCIEQMIIDENNKYKDKMKYWVEKKELHQLQIKNYKEKEHRIKNSITWAELFRNAPLDVKCKIAALLIEKIYFKSNKLKIIFYKVK